MSDGTLIPAVVLAAGASSRFGAGNKLLADAAGTPVIVRCLCVLLEAGLKPVHVVVAGDGIHRAEWCRRKRLFDYDRSDQPIPRCRCITS